MSGEVAPASAVNPAYVATEETFEGWGVGEDAESALDQPDPEEVMEEDVESEESAEEEAGEPEEEESEEEGEEEEESEEDEEELPEAAEADEEDPEQYTDVGKKGKDRIRQLLDDRKADRDRLAALEARLAAAEQRKADERVANAIESQLAMQRQAFEFATKQREEQERMQREQVQFEVLRARGYEPGNFAHELAIENMRKIDEFVSQMQPQVQTIDQRHAEAERQQQAQMYMSQLTSSFDKALEGLQVKPELREWLFETTKELAILHDATADEAVQLAFQKATRAGVLPTRQAAPTKPKAKPPKAVVEAVAKKGNKSGRKPGKQTKTKGRRVSPEDEAFPTDGEWG